MKPFFVIITIVLSIFLLSSCFGGGSTDTDRDTSSNTNSESDTSVGTSSDIYQETDTNTNSNIGGMGGDAETDSSTNSDTPLPKNELVTVFFNSNGGNDVANIEVELGSLLDAPETTKGGYKFDAWLTEDGEKFEFNEPIFSSFTLYASWIPDKVLIYFDANGGSGKLEPIEATTESKVILPTPEFERYGYFFQGWSLDPNGTYDYYGEKEYTVMGEGNTLYAIWGKTTCYIKYHLDTGDIIYEPFTCEDLPVALEKPSSELGYCDGWFNATYYTEITEIAELEDIDVYQRWVGVHIIGSSIYGVDNIFESLTIPKTNGDHEILYIKNHAFKGCDKLKSLILPDSVCEIGVYAFEDCTSLNNIYLPNSISKIDNYAFKNCSSLAIFDLPTNLTTLGSGAFTDCVSITEFKVPNSITALGINTFDGCTSLETVSFGKDLTKVPTNNFFGCKKLNTINIDPENPNFKSVNGNILSINEKNLLLVAPAKSLIEDAIPSTVTAICKNAFSEIEGIENLVIPDHVTLLERSAFEGAPSIRALDTGSLYSIPRSAFANMPHLVTLKINEATKIVDEQAFYNCHNLTSVSLVGTFESFSDTAFENSNKILEVFNLTGVSGQYYGGVYKSAIRLTANSEPSLVEINEDFVLFSTRDGGTVYLVGYLGDEELISLPDRAAASYIIFEEAFKQCDTITEISIPDSVTIIEDYAFYDCSNLKKVALGKGVSQMSGASFHLCSNIEEFQIDKENKSYIKDGDAIYTADKTELIKYIKEIEQFAPFEIPEGVTKISDSAFSGVKLRNISLPSTLTHIGNYAFYMTRIGTITIPSNVSYIGRESLNTDMLYSLTFETPSVWRGYGGWFDAQSLSDPLKNAEMFTETIVKDYAWRRE